MGRENEVRSLGLEAAKSEKEQELWSQTDLGSHAFSLEAAGQEASRGASLRFRT